MSRLFSTNMFRRNQAELRSCRYFEPADFPAVAENVAQVAAVENASIDIDEHRSSASPNSSDTAFTASPCGSPTRGRRRRPDGR